MAEFLEDPSVLTKEKLKSELLANDVLLPSGEHKKEVYIQLYLKNLTAQNKRKAPPADTFSSDEEITPVLSNRSRSGKKATKKTDKARKEEVDVFSLTDEDLKVQLLKYGINPGPIVASTRKLYEKRLQKLLDQPPSETTPPEPETAVPETVTLKADGNQNGNTNSVEDQYSDKDEAADPEPEPVPVASKPVRSRGKTPVTTRTSSRQRSKLVEETQQADSVDGRDLLKDLFPNEPATPTGITATCRRPIHGAAGRPVRPMDLWPEESLLQKSVYTTTTTTTKSSLMDSRSAPSSVTPPARRSFSIWLKLLVFLTLVGTLFYIFQNVTPEQIDTCKLFIQDSVVNPLLSAIGVVDQEESGGGK
ncbi:thymopoietin b [Astyanax mexicanus]|uniref:Lamina-associated polypeptide 2, isoforms beta/delta/epsilon/gamma n=1 Tax=Astyanax mexicanus TaxID=7994 RepID=A0A8B9LAL2_ASTMX|nr:thymopoietin b [Astyanax mexicanus]KAG9281066.1 lamina-associated polypeptide 2, isoforms beta/delta/epsilon/gamma [Astyanax mexicanus]